jgi:diketogulonate reductase-like aldo/keto reductase
MPKDIHSTAKLNDDHKIPYLGLGTWQSRNRDCARAVSFALSNGYDMIDTAQIYNNEAQVGKGWQESGRPRESFFLTTKIWNMNQGYKAAKKSFNTSLRKLGTDYVDLLLIHWPNVKNFSRTVETWQAMIELQKEGLVWSIGVSNFIPAMIDKLVEQSRVVPAVNQVEFHVFLYQEGLAEYSRDNGIQLEAYSPLARGKFLNNSKLLQIAQKHGKSPAQVMLAWLLWHDIVAIPKSVHEQRILENADIFFELDEEDMTLLDGLNRNERLVKFPWAPSSWKD